MKANELMIGDWVNCPKLKCDEDDGNMRIKQLYCADLDCDSFKELKYSEIEPIPLTTEILERNGLELSSTGSHFNEDKDYLLEISFYKNEILWTINLNEYDILKLEYVHELQHALRLCGIEKEIEL